MEEKNSQRQLPGAEYASIPDAKLEYLLDSTKGHGKAALFARIGFDLSNAEGLRDAMLAELLFVEAEARKENPGGGTNYEARMTLKGPTGSADFTTIWAVNPEGAHLVTAYRWRPRQPK